MLNPRRLAHLLLSSPLSALTPGQAARPHAYLRDVMAEAVAPVAVETKLSQGCNAGFAAGEAASVVSFNGCRNQSVDIFFRHAVCSTLS